MSDRSLVDDPRSVELDSERIFDVVAYGTDGCCGVEQHREPRTVVFQWERRNPFFLGDSFLGGRSVKKTRLELSQEIGRASCRERV